MFAKFKSTGPCTTGACTQNVDSVGNNECTALVTGKCYVHRRKQNYKYDLVFVAMLQFDANDGEEPINQ